LEFSVVREAKAFGKSSLSDGFTAQENMSLREGQRENSD
jgi:hypothetical protein